MIYRYVDHGNGPLSTTTQLNGSTILLRIGELRAGPARRQRSASHPFGRTVPRSPVDGSTSSSGGLPLRDGEDRRATHLDDVPEDDIVDQLGDAVYCDLFFHMPATGGR